MTSLTLTSSTEHITSNWFTNTSSSTGCGSEVWYTIDRWLITALRILHDRLGLFRCQKHARIGAVSIWLYLKQSCVGKTLYLECFSHFHRLHPASTALCSPHPSNVTSVWLRTGCNRSVADYAVCARAHASPQPVATYNLFPCRSPANHKVRINGVYPHFSYHGQITYINDNLLSLCER